MAALGDAMQTVLDAAATTTPGSDAYGQLCRMVPDALNLVQQRAVAALTAGEESLHDTADALRLVAAEPEGTHRDNADDIDGVAGLTLDGLAAVSDPIGTVLPYGVAWIIEHVEPLRKALDWLAGDPAQITANAETWKTHRRRRRD
ncbi:hypothetical protein [Dactylosporangium sp. CA-139066]|uniref:hypothetical protein n=1 Tax=Dactylosporangium sp. CA-139066 TaxID=3239930 RepID=UPI003D8FDFE0